MRILVIEDQAKAAKFLKRGLGKAGFVVEVAGDGLQGLYLAQEDCKFGCGGKDRTQARSIARRKAYREILPVGRSWSCDNCACDSDRQLQLPR